MESRLTEERNMYLFKEDGTSAWSVGAKTVDVSDRGLSFQSKRQYEPGTVIWCAVPSRSIYTRAMVCHSTGRLWQYTTGLRFLLGNYREA